MRLFVFSAILLALPLAGAKKKTTRRTASVTGTIRPAGDAKNASIIHRSPGSLYTANGRLADGFRDVRASQVYDLVTIVVSESSSAVSTGTTKTARQSSVAASVASGVLPKGSAAALCQSGEHLE